MAHHPYESTVLCNVCGVRLPIFKSVTRDGVIHIAPHSCDRYLVAVKSRKGALETVYTSEQPGVTGPIQLVRVHGHEGVEEWGPIGPGSGWKYYWHPTFKEAYEREAS
jgi:hypothetical protein